MEIQHFKISEGTAETVPKKEVDNDTDLPQKARKVSSTLSSNLKTKKQTSKHISKLEERK